MSQHLLQTGVGSFAFQHRAAVASATMPVFYACPPCDLREAPIVVAVHGVDRAAKAFCDALADEAMRRGQILLVPEFDDQRFPGVQAYNFGGVRGGPAEGVVLPRDDWSFGIIDRLFHHVRNEIGSARSTFRMFGNSAGAQFLLRYLALTDAPNVDLAVASNCGAYMLPDLAVDYPAGMGGLGLGDAHLQRYFDRQLVILLGAADTDPLAHDLPRSDAAMAQGPHRLAWGFWHFGHCQERARGLGMPLRWMLEIVDGAGHVSPEIYDRALDILSGPS